MFVIHRVEFEVVDKVSDVRGLHHKDTVRFKKGFDTGDHAVNVRDVRHDVIRNDHVSAISLPNEFLSEFAAEELIDSTDAALGRHRGDVAGGLDAEDRN